MTLPIYAAMTGALILLLQQILMLRVGAYRFKSGVSIGTGDNLDLERKIRRHSNLAENSGLFIAVLALTELVGAPQAVVMAFGAAFIFVRLSHALSFSALAGSHGQEGSAIYRNARIIGAGGNFLVTISLAIYLLFLLLI